MVFSDANLVEDEVEVGANQMDPSPPAVTSLPPVTVVTTGVTTSMTGAVGAEKTCSVTPCASC
jgi:hypothetical protein